MSLGLRNNRLGNVSNSVFSSSFYTEQTFLGDLLPEIFKTTGFLKTCRHFHRLLPVEQTIETNCGSWLPLDFLEKQANSFRGAFCRIWLVRPRYSLDVEQFFQKSSPFAINYCDSHHLEKRLNVCFPKALSNHCNCVIFWLWGKSFSRGRIFSKNSSRTRLFRNIFYFRIHISLLNALVVSVWNLSALRRLLPNSDSLSLTFEMTKHSVPAKFGLKLG